MEKIQEKLIQQAYGLTDDDFQLDSKKACPFNPEDLEGCKACQ